MVILGREARCVIRKHTGNMGYAYEVRFLPKDAQVVNEAMCHYENDIKAAVAYALKCGFKSEEITSG